MHRTPAPASLPPAVSTEQRDGWTALKAKTKSGEKNSLSITIEDLEDGSWSVAELAKLLGAAPITIYRHFESGKLPGIKLGGRIRFPKRLIAKCLSENGGKL
jgi:excisionase family DNA binding protein